jgi:cysteine synthase B
MSILSAIGNTPLVEFTNLNSKKPNVRIFGKLEGTNPGGSIKDRPAYWMIKKAEEAGQLTLGKIILEPTSGNTGIALAMIGAAKGYQVKLCMPECVSTERQHILEVLSAEVVLTPAKEGTDGAIRKAHQLLEAEPDKYYMPNQFTNENNVLAHYETTGPEILSQTNGEIDVFVAGMGTTGTLMGVCRFFKEKKPEVKVIGVEPPEGHAIQGLKNMKESIVPEIYNPFVGMSSGAAVAGALHIAEKMTSGTVVVILPDRGDRYLSTTLFRSICAKCPP